MEVICQMGCGNETSNRTGCCDACIEAEARAEERYDRALEQDDRE